MLGFDRSENLTQLSDTNQHPHVGVEFHCQLDLVEPTPMLIHHHRAVGFVPPSRSKGLTGMLQSGVGFVKFAVDLGEEKLTIAEVRSQSLQGAEEGRTHAMAFDFRMFGEQLTQKGGAGTGQSGDAE